MKILECKVMKAAVVISGIVFGLGIVLQIPAMTSLFGAVYFEVILAFLGLMGMFAGLALVLFIAVVTVFPKTSKRLKLCEH